MIEVFCTVNYTSLNFSGLPSKLIIESCSCSLVLKISFVQKMFFFTLCSEYFLLYIFLYVFVNLVMFFSLFFICAFVWMLVYLQFTKYGLVFMWLKVTANKFRQRVFCCQQSSYNTKKLVTCKYHQNDMLWNTLKAEIFAVGWSETRKLRGINFCNLAIYLKFCGINSRGWCLERLQNDEIRGKNYEKCRIFGFELLI